MILIVLLLLIPLIEAQSSLSRARWIFNTSSSVNMNASSVDESNHTLFLPLFVPFSGGWPVGNLVEGAARAAFLHFTPLLSGKVKRVIVDVYDTQCDAKVGLIQASELLYSAAAVAAAGARAAERRIVVVGGGCSVVSAPLALLLSGAGICQMSWGSTSPDLSDKNTYPLFTRGVPSDVYMAAAWCATVRSFGWQLVAVACTTQNLHSLIGQSFLDQCGYEIKVYSTLRMIPVTEAKELTAHVDAIRLWLRGAKAAGVRVFFLSSYTSDARVFLRAALQEKMLGTPGYAFIGTDSFMTAKLSFWEDDEELRAAASGLLSFDRVLDAKSAATAVFLDELGAKSIDEVDPYAGYMYDSIGAVVKAVNMVDSTTTTTTTTTTTITTSSSYGTRICSALRNNVSFPGVTGLVELNENGDRDAGIMMVLISLTPAPSQAPLSITIAKKLYYLSGVRTLSIIEANSTPIVWPGGVLNAPEGALVTDDGAPQQTTASLGFTLVIIVVCVTLISSFIWCVGTVGWRQFMRYSSNSLMNQMAENNMEEPTVVFRFVYFAWNSIVGAVQQSHESDATMTTTATSKSEALVPMNATAVEGDEEEQQRRLQGESSGDDMELGGFNESNDLIMMRQHSSEMVFAPSWSLTQKLYNSPSELGVSMTPNACALHFDSVVYDGMKSDAREEVDKNYGGSDDSDDVDGYDSDTEDSVSIASAPRKLSQRGRGREASYGGANRPPSGAASSSNYVRLDDLLNHGARIVVWVLNGRGLVSRDLRGGSDVYCKVRCGNQSFRTPYVPRALDPVWHELDGSLFGGINIGNGEVDDEAAAVFDLEAAEADYGRDLSRLRPEDLLGYQTNALNRRLAPISTHSNLSRRDGGPFVFDVFNLGLASLEFMLYDWNRFQPNRPMGCSKLNISRFFADRFNAASTKSKKSSAWRQTQYVIDELVWMNVVSQAGEDASGRLQVRVRVVPDLARPLPLNKKLVRKFMISNSSWLSSRSVTLHGPSAFVVDDKGLSSSATVVDETTHRFLAMNDSALMQHVLEKKRTSYALQREEYRDDGAAEMIEVNSFGSPLSMSDVACDDAVSAALNGVSLTFSPRTLLLAPRKSATVIVQLEFSATASVEVIAAVGVHGGGRSGFFPLRIHCRSEASERVNLRELRLLSGNDELSSVVGETNSVCWRRANFRGTRVCVALKKVDSAAGRWTNSLIDYALSAGDERALCDAANRWSRLSSKSNGIVRFISAVHGSHQETPFALVCEELDYISVRWLLDSTQASRASGHTFVPRNRDVRLFQRLSPRFIRDCYRAVAELHEANIYHGLLCVDSFAIKSFSEAVADRDSVTCKLRDLPIGETNTRLRRPGGVGGGGDRDDDVDYENDDDSSGAVVELHDIMEQLIAISSSVTGNVAMFVAPESWRGKRPTEATDVYSLALVAYCFFAMRVCPYGNKALSPIVAANLSISGQVPRFDELETDVQLPHRVMDLFQKSLSNDPNERPSMVDLITELDDYVDELYTIEGDVVKGGEEEGKEGMEDEDADIIGKKARGSSVKLSATDALKMKQKPKQKQKQKQKQKKKK